MCNIVVHVVPTVVRTNVHNITPLSVFRVIFFFFFFVRHSNGYCLFLSHISPKAPHQSVTSLRQNTHAHRILLSSLWGTLHGVIHFLGTFPKPLPVFAKSQRPYPLSLNYRLQAEIYVEFIVFKISAQQCDRAKQIYVAMNSVSNPRSCTYAAGQSTYIRNSCPTLSHSLLRRDGCEQDVTWFSYKHPTFF